MGFYGNITNVNKSTFQFDKIYPNRREMDNSCATDGVFVGRYVLVDYDEESIISYVHAQVNEEYQNRPVVVGYQEKRRVDENQYEILNNKFYSGIPRVSDDGSRIESDRLYVIDDDANEGIKVQDGTLLLTIGYIITEQTVTENPAEISWTVEYDKDGSDPNKGFKSKIFIANESTNGFVLLKDIDDDWTIWNYHDQFVINHNIDAKSYGGEIGRGWDSTVWQKTYKDGNVTYVMIAELNSVVPTFDISADPPALEEEPWKQKPYYDSDSSNVYYKLHLPSSWGFRIKASEDAETSDGEYSPSDVQGTYYKKGIKNDTEDLAIYWFEDGFDKYLISKPEIDKNSIELTSTGKSGNEYWLGNGEIGEDKDIKELKVMLPTIGETVSKLWDVVYGEGQYRDTLGNRLWNKGAHDLNVGGDLFVAHEPENDNDDDIKIRNTNLQWNTRNGIRAYLENDSEETVKLAYNKTAYNSLAGTINSVHDLVGMIIIEDEDLLHNKDAALADPSNIYFDKATNKYYKKGKKYIFDDNTSISGSNMFDPKTGSYYRLESFAFDNYDDIHSEDKESNEPIFEKVANNYYKVNQNDEIYEDEVYGTINAEFVDLDQLDLENFDPINNEIWWLNENGGNGYHPGDYTRENSTRPRNEVRYYTLTATEITNPNKPVFYQPKKYYLMTKTFVDKPNFTKEQQEQAWRNEIEHLLNNNTDFDYLGLMTRKTKAEEENAIAAINEENQNQLIGYRMLRGVAIDPDESTYIIYDSNRKIGEKTPLPQAGEENYPITEQQDENQNTVRTYSWNGFEAQLQGTTIIEENDVRYYKYDITRFISESHAVLGAKSLKEWKEYVEDPLNEVTAENFNDLVPSINFVRELTDPYYTLSNAEDITNTIIDFGPDDSTQYYYYNSAVSWSHEGQPWYSVITKADFDENQQSLWTESWWTLETEPLPLYYDLNRGYYISEYSYNIIENHEDLIEGKEYFIHNDANDSYSAIAYNEINEQTEVYERIVVKYLRETAPLIFEEDKNDPNCPDYYLVRFTPELKTPFIPNLYYYLDVNEYKLAETFDSSKTYYRYIDKYVTEDQNGVYDLGARWNEEVNVENITVKEKTFEWEFQELPGFAKDINTLHGLILKINQMLSSGDMITRDNSTVQGCINLINDILDKFDQLKPAEILMVDKLGRIHSADWDTKQKSSTALGAVPAVPAGDPVAADNERWLKITTTPGTAPDFKPHIKLEHTFKAENNTTSISNLNTNNEDTIGLYTPILDNMGHVVAKNTETVTLPYGFKTITTGVDLNNNPIQLIANNTQDDINIVGDSWIDVTATNTSENNVVRGLTITHNVPGNALAYNGTHLDNNDNYLSTSTPSFGGTFTVDDWKFDSNGHKAGQETHTVTIPAPIIAGEGNVVGNATLVDGIFTLTKTNVGTLALTGYDLTNNETSTDPISASDSVNTAIQRLEYRINTGGVNLNNVVLTYIPKIANPDYDPNDPESPEFIDDTDHTETVNLMSLFQYIRDPDSALNQQISALEARIAALEGGGE